MPLSTWVEEGFQTCCTKKSEFTLMATGERKVIREGQVEHFISTYICHALVDDSQEASRTINQLLLSLYCEDTFFPRPTNSSSACLSFYPCVYSGLYIPALLKRANIQELHSQETAMPCLGASMYGWWSVDANCLMKMQILISHSHSTLNVTAAFIWEGSAEWSGWHVNHDYRKQWNVIGGFRQVP